MKRIAILLCVLMVVTVGLTAQSSDTILLRGSFGIGGTFVDIEEALDWDNEILQEWDTFHIQGRVQAMPMLVNGIRIGAAIAYERLFYYDIRVPYVPTPQYYWGTVSPVSVLAVGSFDIGHNLFSEASVGAYIFGDGVAPGVEARQGYRIHINDKMAIPISLHAALIFGETLYVPIGLSGGFEYLVDSPF